MVELNCSAIPPFNFLSVVHSHGWYQLAPFLFEDEPALETIVRVRSGIVLPVRMVPVEGGVALRAGLEIGEADRRDLCDQVAWMLDLERDFSEFYQLADREPKLQQARTRAQGRLLRSPTIFEDVVKTILTTNTSWAGTKRMVSALVELYGDSPVGVAEKLSDADPARKAFPTPQRLSETSEEELREKARLGYRAPFVYELAKKAASGELALEALKHHRMPADQLHKFLLGIKGVGGYAAAHLLLLLGQYDYIPVDSWARKLVSVEWFAGEGIGDKEVKDKFETWGNWKALAFWLWDWEYIHLSQE
ncbi:MAG: hypothetical protein JXA25_01645 [Anaerolineales bacterium]|nr:hypothetical protein [Anaerolineales bacterium]